jgi:hypothetical protein
MMQLSHSDRVFFEPISHSYTLDGDQLLMGVTELLSKHGLNADYAGISQDTLDNAAKEGTAIHHEIQDYENGQAILNSPLIEDYKKLGLKFVESEYPVSDYEMVASAIDGVYQGSKKNSVILLDYKTTQKLHRRPLAWQLGIYKVLFEHQNPELTVESCHCLWIDKKTRKIKGLIPIEPVSEAEVLALLDAERNGLLYEDNYVEPTLDLVLGENAITYAEGIGKVARLKAEIKAIEDGLKSFDDAIIQYMEEHGITSMDTPDGKLTKRAGSVQERVDTEKLKSKFPHIWDSVKKTVSTKASLTFKLNE